jgi:hypothetical protein
MLVRRQATLRRNLVKLPLLLGFELYRQSSRLEPYGRVVKLI